MMISYSDTKDFILLKKTYLRLMASSLCVFIVVTGCSTFPASPAQQKSIVLGSKPVNQPIATDVIRYIGYPYYNGVRQKGSILAGDKYSYLISNGSEQLNLLTELQPKNLQIQQPIKIYRYPDNSIYLQLKFNYSRTEVSYSNTEQTLLSQLCRATINNPQSNISAINLDGCELALQGGMYAAVKDQPSTMILNQGLRAEIYPTSTTRAKTQPEIRVIPLNVVLESIELPFELLSIIK